MQRNGFPSMRSKEQLNIRGDPRAVLFALKKHRPGEQSLICLDCMLIVKGVCWVGHNKGGNTIGQTKRDPSSIAIYGNKSSRQRRNWEIASSGCIHCGTKTYQEIPEQTTWRKWGGANPPLLFGHVSACCRQVEPQEEEEPEDEPIAG